MMHTYSTSPAMLYPHAQWHVPMIGRSAKTKRRPKTRTSDQNSLAALSDEQLISRYCKSGDRTVFSTLVSRYERELFNYLRRFLGNAEMAEDAFQGTFLQVHLKCDSFDSKRRFRPWLYAVATNQAIDAQRRNKRHRMVSLDRGGAEDHDESQRLADMLESDEIDPFSATVRNEQKESVHAAVDELSDNLRSVVELVYFQGMSYADAADTLGIPVGTVKSRMHAAVKKLTEAWHMPSDLP